MTRKKSGDRTAPPTAASAALRLMLHQGTQWTSAGHFYQAIDIYYEIMQEYPENPEAREAQARLLKIADSFEDAGKYHQAIAIYRRVAESEPTVETDTEEPSRREQVLTALIAPEQPKSELEEKHG